MPNKVSKSNFVLCAKTSFARAFSPQGEILDYLKACADKYEIYPHIQYNTEIDYFKFDEDLGIWRIRSKHGEETTARVLISAAGPFNSAFIPDIKGKDSFTGKAFHSLHWEHDYDLKGKRVAVIGTGASAIQFAPEIAPEVAQLFIFQRTAPYIAPKPDQAYTEKSKERFRKYPAYQRFWREFIYWFLESRGRSNFKNNKMRAKRKKICLDHLEASISDPALKKDLTPDYELGCKRVLISEDYYPMLERDNVQLIAQGVDAINGNKIQTKNGQSFEVDAIIYGTGFHTTKIVKPMTVIGKDGRNLFQEWNEKGGEAYYGTAVSGFPNLFIMVGPNAGLGHNSIIHMMESQLNYILDYLKHLRKAPSPSSYYDLKPEVQRAFNDELQEKLSKMVWSDGGCKSYYLQNMDGKNTSIWPGSTVTYRKKTKKINWKDYSIFTPSKPIVA